MLNLVVPSLEVILFVVFLSGAVSFGGVQSFKTLIKGLISSGKLSKEPWWHNWTCRFLGIILGTICGLLMGGLLGALLGFAAGGMNVFIVHTVKATIKKKAASAEISEEE